MEAVKESVRKGNASRGLVSEDILPYPTGNPGFVVPYHVAGRLLPTTIASLQDLANEIKVKHANFDAFVDAKRTGKKTGNYNVVLLRVEQKQV